VKMTKLLNIDSNPKTVKGQKAGYMTAILYLTPHTSSGTNVCPMAELAGCAQGCLNTAGHGGIGSKVRADNGLPDNTVQAARMSRTMAFHNDRESFMIQLSDEIAKFIKKAARKGLTPTIRLNGTSDIRWERIPVNGFASIMAEYKDIQFYDYTKTANRRGIPANYHLSLSYSEASTTFAKMITDAAHWQSRNLVVVFRDKNFPAMFHGKLVVSGDETDLRFLDPTNVVVGLYAKGRAKKDTSGFVINTGISGSTIPTRSV